jgi:hypothetical protein
MTVRSRARRLPSALLAVTILVGGVACGGDDDTPASPRPAVELLAPAVEALEAELGGPQEYFEINVDERLVNLFVADDDGTSVVPYLFLDGELQPPAPAQPVVEGTTFAATAIDVDPDTVLDMVAVELPTATMRRFVVLVGPEGALRYEVFVQSVQGGQLAVLVTGDGEVLGVETL